MVVDVYDLFFPVLSFLSVFFFLSSLSCFVILCHSMAFFVVLCVPFFLSAYLSVFLSLYLSVFLSLSFPRPVSLSFCLSSSPFLLSRNRGSSFAPRFLPSHSMGPVLGEVELSGLCVRPTFRRRVFWKQTPRGEPARGNGQEINWQSEPLFLEKVYFMENFLQKEEPTLPINFTAIFFRGVAARCPFPTEMT